jgi:hypothetical protein
MPLSLRALFGRPWDETSQTVQSHADEVSQRLDVPCDKSDGRLVVLPKALTRSAQAGAPGISVHALGRGFRRGAEDFIPYFKSWWLFVWFTSRGQDRLV